MNNTFEEQKHICTHFFCFFVYTTIAITMTTNANTAPTLPKTMANVLSVNKVSIHICK